MRSPVPLLRRLLLALAVLVVADLAVAARPAGAQAPPELRVVGPDGGVRSVAMAVHRGYAALPAGELERLGWSVSRASDGWELEHRAGASVRLREGSPFFRWDDELLQLTSEPYVVGERLHVPAQLVTDFMPVRLAGHYASAPDGGIRIEEAAAPDPEARPDDREPRVVVIDPGHGGRDTGAWGPDGIREKDVALGVALALERALSGYPGLEVHLTRRTDVLVPLWKRGEWATVTRGDRPGVFISIHANALPNRPDHRGFETYFLSDARTEHERRVAANENAPLAMEGADEPEAGDADLSFILKELRNLDHQHWSSLLAELVQERVAPVHPGPGRGVKQGPFAVITNALMPAVLVETGFLTNRDEARTLADEDFQEELAGALAEAVLDFFERYPPGSGLDLDGAGSERR